MPMGDAYEPDYGSEEWKQLLRGAGGRGGGIGRGGSSLGPRGGYSGTGLGQSALGFLPNGDAPRSTPRRLPATVGGLAPGAASAFVNTTSPIAPPGVPRRLPAPAPRLGPAGPSPVSPVTGRLGVTNASTKSWGPNSLLNDYIQRVQQAQQQAAQPPNGNWWEQAANSTDPGWAGWLWRLLGPGGQAGAFNPGGSPVLASLINDTYNKRGAMEDAGDVNELNALGTGDPSLYTAELMQKRADRGLARDASVASARVDSANQVQDLMRQVLGSYLGVNSSELAGRLNRPAQGNGSGQLWGDVAGALISRLPKLGI